MNIVISQPRYLPAINYLQRLFFADCFVLLDNVQRQSRGFENRNKLFIPSLKWLSIPVVSRSREVIFNTKVSTDEDWIGKHKRAIHESYSKHPFYNRNLLEVWYQGVDQFDDFTDIIEIFLNNICSTMGFKPNLLRASVLVGRSKGEGIDNIVNIVESINGERKQYVSGPNGRDYGVKKAFSSADIKVYFHDWEPFFYKQHNQLEFHPYLPFLDCIFNIGVKKTEQKVKENWEFSSE